MKKKYVVWFVFFFGGGGVSTQSSHIISNSNLQRLEIQVMNHGTYRINILRCSHEQHFKGILLNGQDVTWMLLLIPLKTWGTEVSQTFQKKSLVLISCTRPMSWFRWLITVQARVQSQGRPIGIHGGKSCNETGFSPGTAVFPFVSFHQCPYSLTHLSVMLSSTDSVIK